MPTVDLARRSLISDLGDRIANDEARALLIGEPGVGKSFVLDAVLTDAESRGARALRTRGLEPKRSEPFLGLIDLLAEIDSPFFDRLPTIQRVALEVALARRSSTEALPPMALRAGFSAIIDVLLSRGPLVIGIDDVTWLDDETRTLLHYLVTRPVMGRPRVSLIGTHGSDSSLSGHRSDVDADLFSATDAVALTGLSLPALTDALGRDVAAGLSADRVAELFAVTGGNPMWARELAADEHRLGPIVPRSIEQLVETRIASLSPDVLAAFVTLAALGTPRVAELTALSGTGPEPLLAALATGLIREQGGRLSPAHPMLAAAALGRLGALEAMELHARIAATSTDVWRRAHHLDLSAPPGEDERIAAWLQEAATVVRRRGALGSAVALMERSIVRSSPTAPEHDLRVVVLAEYVFSGGEYERAAGLLESVQTVGLDVGIIDRVLPLLLDSLEVSRGEAAALAALSRAKSMEAPDAVREAIFAVYRAEVESAAAVDRLTTTEQALAVLVAAGVAPITQHRALGAMITVRFEAGDGLDLALLARSAEMETGLDLLAPNDSAQAQTGFNAYRVDDVERSRLALTGAIELANASGERVMAGLFAVHLAAIATLEGHLDEAAAQLEAFDEVDPWVGSPPPVVVLARGMLAIASGDDAAFEALLATDHGPGSELQGRLVRLALRGIRAARREDWTVALPLLTHARELAETAGTFEPGKRFWLDVELGETQLALGEIDAATATIAWLGVVADRGNRPLVRGAQLRLLGLIRASHGDLADAQRLLEESVAVLDGSPFALEASRSRLELGRVLRRRRARAAARTVLVAALARAEMIGDQPLIRRTRTELARVPAARSGTVLTATERQIAAAAGAGLSNQQIATARFTSVRTVEAHLSATYRKSGVHSRGRLAAWLRDQDPGDVPPP